MVFSFLALSVYYLHANHFAITMRLYIILILYFIYFPVNNFIICYFNYYCPFLIIMR